MMNFFFSFRLVFHFILFLTKIYPYSTFTVMSINTTKELPRSICIDILKLRMKTAHL